MNTNYTTKNKHVKIHYSFNRKYKMIEEKNLDAGEVTLMTLRRLGMSLSLLPSRTVQLLRAGSDGSFDTHALALRTSAAITASLDDEYQILKLRQKKKELNTRIARNAVELTKLRDALAQAYDDTPGDDKMQSDILRVKLGHYKESALKALASYDGIEVPQQIHPHHMRALATSVDINYDRAASWNRRADDITFSGDAKSIMDTLA